MKNFNFYMPTQIRFGEGRINYLKEIIPSYGKKCLIVSRPVNGSLSNLYERIKSTIINQRKLKLIQSLNKEILNDALKSNKYEIFK